MKIIRNLKNKITDRIYCSAIIRIKKDEEEIKIGKLIYSKRNVDVLIDHKKERVLVYERGVLKSILSYELYEQARSMLNIWYEGDYEVWVTKEKDNPVIFINKPMGIIVAPRMEVEDLEEKKTTNN